MQRPDLTTNPTDTPDTEQERTTEAQPSERETDASIVKDPTAVEALRANADLPTEVRARPTINFNSLEEEKEEDAPQTAEKFDAQFETLKEEAVSTDEKHARQRRSRDIPFQPDEKIHGEFVVRSVYQENGRVDPTHIALEVADTPGTDIDRFVIEVTPEERDTYLQSPGTVYEGIVEVQARGKNTISNVFQYPADQLGLRSSTTINPDRATIENMKPGERVLLEGEVTSIIALSEQENLVQLTTEEGKLLEAALPVQTKYTESPGLENGAGKTIAVGDTIQVAGTVFPTPANYPAAPEQAPPKKIVSGPWTGTAFLLEPSEERAAQYNELRQQVATELEEMKSLLSDQDFDAARDVHGQLMRRELTQNEIESFDQLHAQFPDAEKPIRMDSLFESEAIRENLGEDINSLTSDEFKEFARYMVSSSLSDSGRNFEDFDETYIYRAFDAADLSTEEREEILTTAVDSEMKLFSRLDEQGKAFDSNQHFSDKYFLEGSLGRLASLRTPGGVDTLVSALDDMMNQPFAGEADGLRYKVASSLRYATSAALMGEDHNFLEHVREHSAELQEMRDALLESDNRLDNRTAEFLNTAIRHAQPKFDDLRSEQFEDKMLERIDALVENNPVIAQMADTIRAEGYQLKQLLPGDNTLPERLRGQGIRVNAATIPESKEIYFGLWSIESMATDTGASLDETMANVVGNEALHVLRGTTFTPMKPAERIKVFLDLREAGADPTEAEQIIQNLLVEEIASEYIGRATVERLSDPEFKVGPEYIRSNQKEFEEIIDVYAGISASAVFNQPLDDMAPGDRLLLQARLNTFIHSGELEQGVEQLLKEYELFDPDQ